MFAHITTWKHVFIGAAAITLLAVTVPVIAVWLALWGLPFAFKLSWLAVAGFIPLFIAFPIAVFSLNILRTLNGILETLDGLVKNDGLTGLLNRSHFYHLADKRRHPNSHLAIVDADHFKRINDTYGHEAGDLALKHLANKLTAICGPYGLVGRLGGEEFGIYLPELELSQCRILMAALGSSLRNSAVRFGECDIVVTVSIGLAMDFGVGSLDNAARQADKSLYAAKHAGRDCCFIANGVDEPVPLAA